MHIKIFIVLLCLSINQVFASGAGEVNQKKDDFELGTRLGEISQIDNITVNVAGQCVVHLAVNMPLAQLPIASVKVGSGKNKPKFKCTFGGNSCHKTIRKAKLRGTLFARGESGNFPCIVSFED